MGTLKTLTQKAFSQVWNKLNTPDREWGDIGDQIIPYTGGTVEHTHAKELHETFEEEPSHQVEFVIIRNPTHKLTNAQLCAIFDEGNHCISTGSIIYEDNYAYITWSNKGHI